MEIVIGILAGIAIVALLKALEKLNKGQGATVSAPEPAPSNGNCKEYLNNLSSAIVGVNYIDCAGNAIINQTVAPNQSICVQSGTLHGGDSGFLVELGNC